MRPTAFLAWLVALALTATHAAAAPPQPPPDRVVVHPHDLGALVDWSASEVPVEAWTLAYEVLRQQIAPVPEPGYTLLGKVPPTVAEFIDRTVPDAGAFQYCVRAVTVDGPQACSAPAYYIDLADCLFVHGAYTIDLDTHCLYTTDPPLPIPYPTCAPAAAQVHSNGTFQATPRTACLQIWP